MTDLKAFPLLCSYGLLLVLTAFVSADVVGLVTEKKTDPGVPEGLSVCNVYVQFDDPTDKLINVGLSQISTDDPLGFWQHELGTDTAPLQALIDQVDATLAFDSFVTIGLKAVSESGDGTSTDPDWNTCAFNCLDAPPCDPGSEAEPGVCGDAVGGWFNSNPTNSQSDPDADLRVLIAQFTVSQGSGVAGVLTVWINTGWCLCADGLPPNPDTGLCSNGQPPPAETCDQIADLPFTCVACESAADCDDGNDCTIDACDAGQCSHTPQSPGTSCEADGDLCTVDQCDEAGLCVTVDNVSCADPIDECDGGELCNPGTGLCELQPDAADGTPCSGNGESDCSGADTCLSGACEDNDLGAGAGCLDDGNACTDDVCDGLGACTHPFNTAPCDDGLFCNGPDTCSGGTCSVHAGDPCAEGSECADNCNETDNDCFGDEGAACSDDGNECTDDVCDGSGACTHPDATDGTSCTGNGVGDCSEADTCLAGTCQDNDLKAGTGCPDDGNECTDDVCDGLGACTHPNATDGTSCTGNGVGECTEADTCLAGTCEDNDQPPDTECELDGDACTLDRCDAAGQCVFDSNVSCPDGEVCEEGECVPDCGPCPTDVNGNGETDPFDLASLLAQWGPTFPGNCLDADGNEEIDPFDLATLLAAWGLCP